jgi:hypothetical protein
LALAGLVVSAAACGSSASTSPVATPTATPSVTAAPTASPVPADAYPLLAQYEGNFKGTWTNTTFGSKGSMAWDITADPSARTIKIVVNVGGNFFGGPGAKPETLLLTRLADGVVAGTSPTFGEMNGTITPEGELAITLANVPGGVISKVDISGLFSGTNMIAIDYEVSFAAGGAKAMGKVVLQRA